jgi:hypothetical protein
MWSVAPNGRKVVYIVTHNKGESEDVQITGIDPYGNQVFATTLALTSKPIPAAVADSAVAAILASPILALSGARGIETQLRNRLPSYYPPVNSILIGSDGRIWIGLYPDGDESSWLVLDEHGRLQMRVLLPKSVLLHAADGTHIYGEERDELGVGSIVKLRIISE